MVSSGDDLSLDRPPPSVNGGWMRSEASKGRNYWIAEHDDIVSYPSLADTANRIEDNAEAETPPPNGDKDNESR